MKFELVIGIGDIITFVTLIIFITAVIFSYRQLLNTKKAAYSATAKMVFEILQNDKVRDARRHVFTSLTKKEFTHWSDDDKSIAEIVCNTYDEVGILVKYGMLPEQFVEDHWNDSLIKSWSIVKPLVFKYRQNMNPEYWDDFESLVNLALIFRKKVEKSA